MRKIAVTLAAMTAVVATLIPATPAAAGCAGGDPVTDTVVCGVVYPAVQTVTCKVGRLIDPTAGCMT